uniref:Uncharacterized protein n=1 Tax=Euplotes harpa TaxID=151035 RepID=A0A7S3J2Z4_9SPIT|mmetsp:Transcript_16683/g.19313  ORF Transcript_16683/g.19313 Transcript_16683/m.19313 type:complete len:160 (+) Transcript_16683:146-625(+)
MIFHLQNLREALDLVMEKDTISRIETEALRQIHTTARLFSNKNPTSKAYSFGIAREAYSKVYLKGHKQPDMARDIPGPGTYNNNLYDALGKTGMSYTLRPRTGNMSIVPGSKGVPGPGSYEFKASLTSRGNQFLSKYRSSGATTFNPPQSKRFKNNIDK